MSPVTKYEVLPIVRDEVQGAELAASYTPNNGIRIEIFNDDMPDWAVFDLTPVLAAAIGETLIKWATAAAPVDSLNRHLCDEPNRP